METPSSLNILLSTDPGIEATVEKELLQKCAKRGWEAPAIKKCPTGHAGTVEARFQSASEETQDLLFGLRSIHHVLKELDLFQLPEPGSEQLSAIRQRISEIQIPEFRAHPEEPFRVSCDRLGEHPFSSMEVLQEAGAAIQENYGLPVDLENFTFHFRVDIYEKACRIGLQWTRSPLSKRGRPFLPRIALKGNIAYALLQALEAEEEEEGPLLDPFCGSGTVLNEAASVFPKMSLYGSDNFPRNIPGADRNLRAFGVRERVDLRELDARYLHSVHPPESIRYIATNPPYGLQMGARIDFYQLYSQFLQEAWQVLQKEGRMSILVMKKGLFREVLEKHGGFKTLEERELVMGKIHVWLYLLKKVS